MRTIIQKKMRVKIPEQARQSPLLDLYLRPGFLLRRASQIAASIAARECGKFGLTPPQHAFLMILDRCPGLDQRALGKALGIDRVTAGQVLWGLECRKLIKRAGSKEDRRRKAVKLTAEGKRLVGPAMAATERISQQILSVLEPAEGIMLVQLLVKTVIALNEESPTPVEPPPPPQTQSG